jgi:hypothetical protein
VREPSLSLKLDDFRMEVGYYLGYGRNIAVWGEQEIADVKTCVDSGVRNFYYPIPPGETMRYDWSFMCPMREMTIAEGESEVDLPDDFGGIEGDVFVTNADGTNGIEVKVENEGAIRRRFLVCADATGRPWAAAVAQPKETSTGTGQRAKLAVYPTTDDEYTLRFKYYVLGDALTESRPYPLGGSEHAETVLESCLAVAELRILGRKGEHGFEFDRRLMASVNQDRRLKPQYTGYNADRSYRRWGQVGNRRWWFNQRPITINGVEPD